MKFERLVTKCPWTWHNQGMHHSYYGLGPRRVDAEQVHTDFILVGIMQDMIVMFYLLFGNAVCMYALSF